MLTYRELDLSTDTRLRNKQGFKYPACPKCSASPENVAVHSKGTRRFVDLEKKEDGTYQTVLHVVTRDKFYCAVCKKHFMNPVIGVTGNSRYGDRLKKYCLEKYLSGGMSFDQLSVHMRTEYGISVPGSTISDWSKEDA